MMRIAGILLILIAWIASGQDTLTIDRIDYRFVSIEKGVLTPLTSLKSEGAAGFFISCQDDVLVEFCGREKFTVWVDGRLAGQKVTAECIYKTTFELCALSERDTIYVSLATKSDLEGVSARSVEIVEADEEDIIPVFRLGNKSGLLGFIVCGLLIVGISFISPVDTRILVKANFDEFNERPFTIPNLIETLGLLIVGSFIWFSIHNYDLSNAPQIFMSFLSLLLLKTVVYLISGGLFNLKRIGRWQVLFQLHFWFLASIGFLLLLLIDQLFVDHFLTHSSAFPGIILGCLVVFIVSELFILSSYRGVSSLHLFIYLCTTEILPVILAVAVFLK